MDNSVQNSKKRKSYLIEDNMIKFVSKNYSNDNLFSQNKPKYNFLNV